MIHKSEERNFSWFSIWKGTTGEKNFFFLCCWYIFRTFSRYLLEAFKYQIHSPLSTFVIDIPLLGVRIARKHNNVELNNFIKLRLRFSPLSSFCIAAAFRSISEDLHDDVEEFCESRREFFLKQMQLFIMFPIFSQLLISFPIFSHFT